jgi:hypothetical protein
MVYSFTSVLMATSTPTKGSQPRPGALRNTKSFPRHEVTESSDPLVGQRRSNTFQNGAVPEITVTERKSLEQQDTFESCASEDAVDPPRASVDMDEIPIELVSMVDK